MRRDESRMTAWESQYDQPMTTYLVADFRRRTRPIICVPIVCWKWQDRRLVLVLSSSGSSTHGILVKGPPGMQTSLRLELSIILYVASSAAAIQKQKVRQQQSHLAWK